MSKFILGSIYIILIGLVTSLVFFLEQEQPGKSIGERQKYNLERANLQIASDIFWMLHPFMNASDDERRSETFFILESQLQLNVVRLQFLIETGQIKLSDVKNVAETTVKSVRDAANKRKMNFQIWTDPSKSYDLGTNELFLPRFYPVARELIKIVGAENFEVKGNSG